MLERGELPLLRALGRELAEVLTGLHRHHGVDLYQSVLGAEIIEGDSPRATRVRLVDGNQVDADPLLVWCRDRCGSCRRRVCRACCPVGLPPHQSISADDTQYFVVEVRKSPRTVAGYPKHKSRVGQHPLPVDLPTRRCVEILRSYDGHP